LAKTALISEPSTQDLVLLEINRDATTAAVVFGGGIVSTRVLNIGINHLVSGITEEMGLTSREADKVLRSYISSQLTQGEAEIVRTAVREVLTIWLSGLELMFAEFSGVKTFPSKVYLAGEGSEVPDLWNMLTTEPWTKAIPFKALPAYKKISFLELKNISDSTGKVSTAEWLPLASLSKIYFEMKGTK
jgi:Tfp pilus assembly PilM family ATPase